jgi:hypothetical protein
LFDLSHFKTCQKVPKLGVKFIQRQPLSLTGLTNRAPSNHNTIKTATPPEEAKTKAQGFSYGFQEYCCTGLGCLLLC